MSPITIASYLFGNAAAIRKVAVNRASLWTGIVLVLLTSIARNYDQNYFFETPFWLIGSLIFSFLSGSFLYWIIIRGYARPHFEPHSKPRQWATFMALFWMTAPIAWLYAIPVERIFDSYRATQANLILLAIVSLWRVLLMSRILSVLLQVPFRRALGWVLVAASMEVIVVLLFGPGFGQRILESMGGVRNAPEEDMLISVLSTVWIWSWLALVLAHVLVFVPVFRGMARPLPEADPGRMPWPALLILTVFWMIIAWPSQIEQYRFLKHAELVERGRYSEALAFLARHEQSDFPPSRRLEPNPYEYPVWEHLPPTVALLTTNTPPWIRNLYLSYAASSFTHHRADYSSITEAAAMYAAIEQLPEGRQWFLTNQPALVQQGINYRRRDDGNPLESAARSNLIATLRRMGMAETNLVRFSQ